MNIIEVKFSIDINDNEQVKNLNAFIEAQKGKVTMPTVTGPVSAVSHNNGAPKPEPAKAETKAEAPKADAAKFDEKSNAIANVSLDEIKKAVSERVNLHRETIKAKYTEYGINNSSELSLDKYDEFWEFLQTLKTA